LHEHRVAHRLWAISDLVRMFHFILFLFSSLQPPCRSFSYLPHHSKTSLKNLIFAAVVPYSSSSRPLHSIEPSQPLIVIIIIIIVIVDVVVGRDSTHNGLDGLGIESGVRARFSAPVQTGPGAPRASYTMGTGSFPGVKRPGRGADHPHPSTAEVKELVELYIYHPHSPPWLF
jgi:hypothetical protein